jgi:hypothetical protein
MSGGEGFYDRAFKVVFRGVGFYRGFGQELHGTVPG